MLGCDLPSFGVGQAPMRQGSLAPPRVEETNSCVVVCHVRCGGFNGSTIRLREQCCLLSLLLDEVVHLSHENDDYPSVFPLSLRTLPTEAIRKDYLKVSIREGR